MKYALIIGNNKYNDPKLAQLKTPAADSQALAKVLDDKTIGSFDEVTPLINQTETRIRRAISTFLTNKKPDDLVLLYFSGHGVLDDRGRLYLALKDTQMDLLKATSIPSSFIADEMDSCRSKRQILVLDCCHSGAFGRGTKGEQKAVTETTFEGSGFGRVVLTASDSTQYAFEGDQVIRQTDLSLFTHFLLEGLKTGEADTNNDGIISLDEWYDYTYTKVIAETPRQIPHKWSYNQQGDLIIARNPYVKKKVVELPYELNQALESPFVGIRESAVTELGKYLRSRDPEMVELAVSSLEKMKGDDSRRISSLAERLLSEFEQARSPVIKRGAPPSKPIVEPKPETADVASESPLTLPIPTLETDSPLGTESVMSQPDVEKSNIPIDGPSASQEVVFDRSFWFKWIGTTILGIAFSVILYFYAYNNLSYQISIQFGLFAGLSSLIQWLAFQNRLGSWWIAANTATGALLGAFHYYRYNTSEWGLEDLGKLLAFWIIGNFVLGLILMRKTQVKSKDFSPALPIQSLSDDREAGAHQDSSLTLLSIFLVLYAFVAFMGVVKESGLLDVSSWFDASWRLYGIASVLIGIAFILQKETLRNFGFVTLAIFLFLNGISMELVAFLPDKPEYFFPMAGTMSLLSGMFFVLQRETWKNFGYIMLSGYLIFVSSVYFGVEEPTGTNIFSIITAIFALAAAVSFFLRK
jgi:uncharacterized caspase-like protein